MTAPIRAYRLITNGELQTLQETFQRHTTAWNDSHAQLPLTASFSRQTTIPKELTTECQVFSDDDSAIALMADTDFSMMKRCLIGDVSDCFDPIARTLLMTLLKRLLHVQSRTLSTPNFKDWFYTGSPVLSLTLSGGGGAITLFLHPQWVLSALPKYSHNHQKAVSRLDALNEQPIPLHVQLNPLPLKLDDLLRLQVGDVIKTDQLITTALNLTHQQQTVCQVDIGETNTYKSIHITRES